MKTNHQRNFKAKKPRFQGGFGTIAKSELSDKIVGASISYSFTKGNRGMAKAKHGAKKFVRSRIRVNDKMAVRKLLKQR